MYRWRWTKCFNPIRLFWKMVVYSLSIVPSALPSLHLAACLFWNSLRHLVHWFPFVIPFTPFSCSCLPSLSRLNLKSYHFKDMHGDENSPLIYAFQLCCSHLYMITGKTTALSIQTFVSKVMSLLFKTLYRFVIAFLSRNKCLLI